MSTPPSQPPPALSPPLCRSSAPSECQLQTSHRPEEEEDTKSFHTHNSFAPAPNYSTTDVFLISCSGFFYGAKHIIREPRDSKMSQCFITLPTIMCHKLNTKADLRWYTGSNLPSFSASLCSTLVDVSYELQKGLLGWTSVTTPHWTGGEFIANVYHILQGRLESEKGVQVEIVFLLRR